MNLDVISNIRNVIGDVLALGPENFYLGIEMKHFNKLLMATIFVLLSPLVHADFDYALYSGGFNQVPDFTGLTPVKVGKTPYIGNREAVDKTNYALRFTQTINIDNAANYEFRLLSDDGSVLTIDGAQVINHDGPHAPSYKNGIVFLTQGSHDLQLGYTQLGGGAVLLLEYKIEGGIFRPMPASGHLVATIPQKSEVGEWGQVINWPLVAAASANLPDGRIYTWTGNGATGNSGAPSFGTIYDPVNNTFQTLNNNLHALFCSGVNMLEDGGILATGGQPDSKTTTVFDPNTLTWTKLSDMQDARYYGTALTLANNETFTTFARSSGNRAEKFNLDNNAWQPMTNSSQQTFVNEQNSKNSAGGFMQWYADMMVQPDGRVFNAGPTPTFHIFDPVGNTQFEPVGQLTGSRSRTWGNTVSYDVGKLLLVGGADRSLPSFVSNENTYLVDLNGPAPVVTPGAPTNYARAFSNSVPLPNGEVLLIGGEQEGKIFNDDSSIYPAEIYNPETNQWRVVDELSVPRNYHSTAILMKDGRVIAAGGGACNCDVNHLDAQIFSPPYLFNADGSAATRPSLSEVPDQTAAGQTTVVNASGDTDRFVMMRLSGHTHHINTDQRYVPVAHKALPNGQYELSLNPNPNVLLPGLYWLYAVNANGTPSIGETIQVVRQSVALADNDGDGVANIDDLFPNDSAETTDDDGDGVGNNGDVYPNDATKFADSDGDGVDDANDTTPFGNNPTQLDDNIAQGKLASQSSLSSGGLPARAVDGNTSGNYKGNSVTHTNDELHPWWQVDLGEVTPLSSVTLFNRTDSCCTARLSNAYVFVSGGDLTGRSFDEIINDASVWRQYIAGQLPAELSVPVQVAGRFVRVQLDNGYLPLSLAEVQAFAVTPSIEIVDTDGDGVPDAQDAFPNDPSESKDSDGDGIGDNADPTPNGGGNNNVVVELPSHPRNSTTLIVENSTGADRIWNVNPDNNSVSVTAADGAVLAQISVGQKPWSLAKAPNRNQVLVTNKASGTLSVIDTNTLAVTQTVTLNASGQPHGIVFNADGDQYYIVYEASAVVEKRSTAQHNVLQTLTLTGHPRHASMAYDDSRLLVSNFITPPVPGESTATVDVDNGAAQVFVIDPNALSLSNTIAINHDTHPVSESSGPGLPNYLNAPVVTFDNQYAYVPSKKDNINSGALRGNLGMIFDQTVRANTSQINLASESQTTLRLDFDNASVATGAALTGDNRYLLVALETSRELVIYDTVNGFEVMRLDTGRAPQGVALSTDGATVYVHNFMDRSITAFDLTEMITTELPATNLLATVTVVDNETLSAQVLQGKQLFYDAADDRLARDNYMSCASCHNDGSHDGRVWDLTGFGEGLRNTIDLRGRGGMQHGFLHWTSNFDEVQDFEGQIRQLAGGTGLMSNADFNAGDTAEPLGDPKTGKSEDLDALAAYVASLTTFAPSPYKAGANYTPDAIAGRQLFIDNNCASCHSGANFSRSAGADQLADIGTIKASSGSRLDEALTGFDVPTLRDVWQTAPYLHDGSALTLDDAISAHDGLSLTQAEIAQLSAFVSQIGNGEPEGFAGGGTGDTPPVIQLNQPNASVGNASGSIDAVATDVDGTISSVAFYYNGDNLIHTITTPPYVVNWADVPDGTYTITAKATDNDGLETTSNAVQIIVNNSLNTPPTVTLNAPQGSAGNVSGSIEAVASDIDGSISRVQFYYNGGNLLRTVTQAPYVVNWASVPDGTYELTAVAYDDAGAQTTSNAVTVVVDSTLE